MKAFYIILLFLFTAHLNAQSSVDVDIDDDGLIEVSNLETLNAMRYQLDGSGLRINADAEKLTTGCAVGGCKGYELTGDLDFLDATSYQNIANQKLWTSGAGWQPIGNAEHPFNSLFKTNNSSTPHTIFNLTISRESEDNVGLFGRLGSSAEISGVGLLDVQVEGRHQVGGLVGENAGGRVINSYASGIVVGTGGTVGLIVGSNSGSITNSYADGEVSAKNNSVGGLAGVNRGHISNSYAIGRVIGDANNVGGLVGDNSQGVISNSYATGSVAGSEDIGGLVGLSNLGTLIKNYVSGKATGIRYVGGLIGMNIGGTVSYSYWDKTASGLSSDTGGVGLSASELQSASAQSEDLNKPFYQWDTAYWDFGTEDQYPILKYVAGNDAENPACGPEPSLPNCGSLLLGQHASLKHIVLLGNATLTPRFKPTQLNYHLNITPSIKQLQFIPIANNPNAVIDISKGGTTTEANLTSGTTSTAITLESNTEITITVSAPNQRPAQYQLIVNYLPTITITGMPSGALNEGRIVTLDASQSSDVETETLSYRWTQTVGKTLELTNADQPTLAFQIPKDYVAHNAAAAEIGLMLEVNDGNASAIRNLIIEVTKIDNGNIALGTPTLNILEWVAPEVDPSEDPDGVGSNLQYQWQSRVPDDNADWIDIDKATQQTHTPSILTTSGTEYRVRISYTDGQGYETTQLSEIAKYQPDIADADFIKGQATEPELTPAPTALLTATLQCSTTDIDQDNDGLIEICDLEGLNAIRYQLNGTGYKASAKATKITTGCADDGCKGYELMRDLDFWDDASYSSTSNKIIWTIGEGWEPIGYYKNSNDNKSFTAIFEGNSHTISNLMINRSDTSYVGFFGYTNRSSKVTDIGLLNINITGDGLVGGLVGRNQGSVTNSYATGTVNGYGGAGGLVGYNNSGSVTNSYATGTVTGYGHVGGLVGSNDGRITNSYATGAATGDIRVGGLVGFNYNNGRVTNSYATGTVTGDSGVGGLVGDNGGSITNSYATGAVTGNYNVGGLVGWSFRGSVTNSYWNTQTSGLAISAGGDGVTSATTAQLQSPTAPGMTTTEVYYGWSSDDWDFGTSSQYPILKKSDGTLLSPTLRYGLSQLRLAKGYLSPDFTNIIPNYTGSVVGDTNTIQLIPIAIDANARISITGGATNKQEIASGTTSSNIMLNEDGITIITIVVMTAGISVEYNFNLHYYQYSDDADIDNDGLIEIDNIEDLNAIRYQPDGTGYRKESTVPKITTDCPSTGCKGYELTRNLSFAEDSDWSPIALFSGILEGNGYTISNLMISKPNANSVGFFSSITSGAKINNIGLLDIDIQGYEDVGGLVGSNNGDITNSYATGTVTGNNRVGGLVGWNSSGRVTNSYAMGTVTGNNRVGGLVGWNSSSRVTNSYATGAVTGTGNYAGGLVGWNYFGSVTNSYATGTVTGTGWVGGLVGSNYRGSVTNSYWDTQTSGLVTSAGGEGKTTDQLQMLTAATGIYRNWSNTDWDFGTSSQYPTIKYAAGADTDNPACGIAGQPICEDLLPDQYLMLDNLAVSNGTLSPQFNPQTYIYDVVVNYDVEQLELHTTATDATIRITSNTSSREYIATNSTSTVLPLKLTADTVITIKVTKDNRPTTSYILTVTYESNDNISLPSPTVTVDNTDTVDNTESQLEGTKVKLQATLDDGGSCGTTLKCEWSYIDASSSLIKLSEDSLRLDFTIPVDYVDADQSTQNMVVIFAVGNAGGVAREQVTLIVKKINNGSISMEKPTLGHRSLTAPDIDSLDDPDKGVQTDNTTYQWQRTIADNLDLGKSASWEDIAGATAKSYTVPESVAYSPSYRVLISYTDGQGYNTTGISSWLRDIDVDDDGLIEIRYLDELHAIRYQLDGSGYKASAEATKITTGCAISVCKGYELTRYLDFWDDASYSSTSNKIIWTTGEGWEPIGYYKNPNDNKPFTAIFEGNSHTISNLMINRSDTSSVGLFGYNHSSSKVTDIGLLDIDIQGADYASGLVSLNSGRVTNSYATGTVIGNIRVGGLVGSNRGSVTNSYATGTVAGTGRVGGLVGYNHYSSITNSYATGTVTGTGYNIGGLVGYNYYSSITNSYATGTVTGTGWRIGGLVGYNWSSSVTNSYATGRIAGTGENVGGLVGNSSGRGSVTNSYWDTQTSGLTISGGGEGKTTAELQLPTTTTGIYSNWSNTDWDFGTSSQYPILKKSDGTLLSPTLRYGLSQLRLAKGHLSPDFISIIPNYTGSVVVDTNTIQLIPIAINANARIHITGRGTQEIASGATSDDIMLNEDGITTITIVVVTTGISIEYNFNLRYYQYSGDVDIDNDGLIEIDNIEDLDAIRYQPDGTGYRKEGTALKITTGCPSTGCKGYELTRNLSFAEDSDWSPIALFSGIFEGNGYTISKLRISKPNANNLGLFSSITLGGKINNIGLLDIDIQGDSYVGGLVGENDGRITNSYANGAVTGTGWRVGGLVGSNGGSITNSYATGEVHGTGVHVGGLVGDNGGSITNSYATEEVRGTGWRAGGLVGSNGGSITNSYATGEVHGTGWRVGGLVGDNGGSITNSYATGEVHGTGSEVGGLVGNNYDGSITNSYWDTQTSGLATSAGGAGKTTEQLQMPTMATGIYRNWETANWDFGTSSQYPTIKYAAGADTDNPACGIAGQPICGEVLPNQLSLLDNLVVSNGTLSPQFNHQTYIYDVVVNYDVEQLELHTTATGGTIRITSNTSSREYIATNGTSTVLPLKLTADTVITIEVMKDNRRTASYILTVTYASNDDTPKPPSPTVTVTPKASMEGTTLEGTTVELKATLAGEYSCGTELKCEWSYIDVSSSVTEFPLELNFMIPADYVAADQSTQQFIVIFAVGNAGGVAREQVTLIVKKTNNGSISMNEPTLGHRSLTAPEVDDPEGVLTDSIIIYQWQRTIADNLDLGKSASWENITGATAKSYTVSESVAYSPSYRVLIKYTDGQGYDSTGISSWIRDIDVDDDGLIEIRYLDELHAIRYQLDGSGYKANADADEITIGCAISGCKGYELTRYLDFWDDASYSSTSNKIIWTTGEGWEPIGYYKNSNDNKPFTAIFEGNSHTISNLMINRSDTSYVGFFGYTNSSSTVTDIGLLNINIQGADSVGGLVGSNNGSITNSYAMGTVTGNYRVGGLVGSNNGNGSVMSSYATGTVIGTGVHVGGLVGYNNGDITNSYAMGAVTGDRFVGGLVGDNGGSITNSYATGAVTGNSNVGGLVGYNDGLITNSYWNTQTSGLATSAGGDGVTSATTAQLQSPTAPGTTTTEVYYGWSSDDWDFGTSSQYPILKKSDGTLLSPTLRYGLSQLRLARGHLSPDFISIIPSYTGSVVVDTNTIQLIPTAIDANARISITGGATNKQEIASGAMSDDIMLNEDGITTITIVVMTARISIEYNFNLRYYQYSGDVDIDNDGLIEIDNIEGLNAIRYQPDGTGYRQEVTAPKITTGCPSTGCKGYELTRNLSFAEDSDWSPIVIFSGIFEGNGYTISNLTISKPNAIKLGLFGSTVFGSKINNIGLLDIDIQGDSRVGSLVGYNVGDITNSYATGAVTGTDGVGGLVGYNGGNITNSYATGSVAGTYDVGGLVGLNYGDITNSYATGSVTGTSNSVGGLVGYNGAGGSVTNSYATGSVAGTYDVGGLVGENYGRITNSYWDTHTSGLATSAGGEGKTTTELQSPTAPGTMTTEVYYGWSSDDWDFGTSLQYPVLKYATNCDVLEQPACDTPLPGQYLNLLAKLELSDGTLSPAFDSYVFRYDVEVGLDVDDIKITAATTDTDAYLSISSDIMGSIISDQQHSVNDVSVDLTRTGVAVITIEVVQRNRRTTSYILTVTYESRDIDVDDDGLIEIRYLDELHAIRYQLDGSGYKASADVDEITTGCAVGGCKGYELTRDLDFDDDASYSSTSNKIIWTTGEGWEPIGIDDSFSGILQGNGHTISNLMINSPEANYVGLFFMLLESAVIDSIDLSKVDIRGKDHVGGLVGSNAGGTIRAINIDRVDSTIPNRVIGTGNNVGGLVGSNTENGIIEGVDIYGVEIEGSSQVGGLVGSNTENGIIEGVDIYGVEIEGSSQVGGLVGSNAGGTIRAINIGRVDSTTPNRVIGTGNNIGGLVGSNTENGIIEGVDIYGVEIEGSSQVGGLVGKNIKGMIINSSLSGNNNTTANSITATGAKIGGLVGYSLGGYIINSYSVTNIRGATSGRTNGSRIGGLIGQNKSWIISSYAAGSIEANKHVGGLVGWNIRNIINSYARVRTNRHFGSLIGSNKSDDVVIQSSYWNSDVNGNNITGDDQGIAKTTADLQSPTTATGIYGEWSTANWDFGTQKQYPALKYTGHCLGEDVPAYCNDNNLSTTHLIFLQSLCTGKGASDNCGTLLPGQRFGLQSLGLSDNAILIGDFNNEIYSYEILIGNETTSTGIIPVAVDLNAEIELIEGDGSGAINLIGGELHLIELASNSILTIVVADERSEVSYRLGIVRLVPTIDIEQTVFEEGDSVLLVAKITATSLPSVYEYTYQWSGDLLATMLTGNNIQSKISETYVLGSDDERIANIELTVNFMSEGKQIKSYATKSLRITKKDNGSISNIGPLTVSTQTWTLTAPMLPTDVDDGGDPEGIQDGSLSYLWESRTSARAEWQEVTGATNETYQIAETIPAYTEYRVRIGYTDNQLHPIASSAADAPTSLPYTYKVVDRDSNGLINIYTAEQLDAIRYQLDGSSYHPSATTDSMSSLGCSGNNCSGYELKAHIDLNGFNDWQPIGNAGDPFNTTFEGNHYTIYNLTIASTATNSAGLFGVTSLDAKLHDIKLLNVNINAGNYVGGLVGHNQGMISDSYVVGRVIGNQNVGGLVGMHGQQNNSTNTMIINSHAIVIVGDEGSSNVGGLVGHNYAKIKRSYVIARQLKGSSNVGGIIGLNHDDLNDNDDVEDNYATVDSLTEDGIADSCKIVGAGKNISKSLIIGGCQSTSLFE